MADKNCKQCNGTGWSIRLKVSNHGTFKGEQRCQCNPHLWSTVLDIALAREGFWQRTADLEKMEQIDAVLDDLMLDLDRETEDKLKKLLT